ETFLASKDTVIEKIAWRERAVDFQLADVDDSSKRLSITLPSDYAQGEPVIIFFKTILSNIETAREKIKRGMSFVDHAVMGEEGAFLPASSAWYPRRDSGLSFFDVVFDTPKAYTPVMEGRWAETSEKNGRGINRWLVSKPLSGINPVIAKFHIEKDTHKGIDIYTFFFKDDNALSKTYIEKTKGYIDLYARLLTPYPFEKFAIVEGFLPTGYGMPSFTLLGSEVLRLPFIPDTSLGHEFVHNWWGNSIFSDPAQGIWAEALATYTADSLYTENKGAVHARSKRLDTLSAYKDYAEKQGPALKDFTDASDPAQRAVGYGKGSYVFHMLRSLLGDDLFWQGLREFHKKKTFSYASWRDIQTAFELVSGADLDWFFSQWLARKGGPRLSLDYARIEDTTSNIKVFFAISQKTPYYRLHVPVVFETEGGMVVKDITLETRREVFEITLDKKPVSIEIDPMLENFRLLSDKEAPVTLGSFFGDANGVIVLPSDPEAKARYEAVATSLSTDYGLLVIPEEDYKEDYEKKPVFILGGPGENGLFEKLFKNSIFKIKDNLLKIDEKTFDLAQVTVSFATRENERVASAFFGLYEAVFERSAKRLPHYTNKTYLIFKKDGKTEGAVIEGSKPLRIEFN
ncbi:MAG: hypothetical protein HY880_09455, partial [Deltaproteobacteria bacterium]|nr:hypothetical protein [Deltaproteobacteria bacterium]